MSAMDRRYNRGTGPGFARVFYMVKTALNEHPDGLSFQELAKAAGLEPSVLSMHLESLRALNLMKPDRRTHRWIRCFSE